MNLSATLRSALSAGFIFTIPIGHLNSAEPSPPMISIEFSSPLVAREHDVPDEAQGAGLVPASQEDIEKRLRALRNASPEELAKYDRTMARVGPLSKVVQGNIKAIKVNYYDQKIFSTNAQTEDYIRHLLADPTSETDTVQRWSQLLGAPSIEADVTPTEKKPGRLLIWHYPHSLYAVYRDADAKWWFVTWSERKAK